MEKKFKIWEIIPFKILSSILNLLISLIVFETVFHFITFSFLSICTHTYTYYILLKTQLQYKNVYYTKNNKYTYLLKLFSRINKLFLRSTQLLRLIDLIIIKLY